MAAVEVTVEDLAPFATIEEDKAEQMIADALALAERIAPCITEDDFLYPEAAKAIIRGAVLRWNDAGSGVLVQETTGPFSQTIDNRTSRRGMFWPSEISDLQAMCKASGGAFTIETAPGSTSVHDDACSLVMGANYCSCGADIAGVPLWGVQP